MERRKFIRQISTGSLAALGFPAIASDHVSWDNLNTSLSTLAPSDEAYWEMVKSQFAMDKKFIMMNAANLCPSPYAVASQVEGYALGLNKDVSFQYRELFNKKRKESIEKLAGFLGVDGTEIGITSNTSEANCMVAQGLDFKPGDEIIIWDQNHPSNEAIWDLQSKRFGISIKKVATPKDPKSKGELVEAFTKAITAKTKLIAFSHISNVSGICLPAKEICEHAKSKGILTLVDGAQTVGFLDLNLKDMGCSFYTSSTHKWLMGPMENGILFVDTVYHDKVWPSIVGGSWKAGGKTLDEKICVLGQRNDPTTAAMPAMLDFHMSIGKGTIQDRVIELNSYLKEKLKSEIPSVSFITPLEPSLSGGIVIFNVQGKEARDIVPKLYQESGIACAATGGIRLSPHIYNTKKDIDKVIAAIKVS